MTWAISDCLQQMRQTEHYLAFVLRMPTNNDTTIIGGMILQHLLSQRISWYRKEINIH